MRIIMDNDFLKLLQVFDPLFPIGSFTMSNGLETYVQKGIITDAVTLQDYLDGMLHILPFSDLGFAAKAIFGHQIPLLDRMCAASKTAYELRQSSHRLCIRFLKNVCDLDDFPKLRAYLNGIMNHDYVGCYPIAVGIYLDAVRMDPVQGLHIYCYSLLSAAVNHAVKLVPLRQMDGQRVLYTVLPQIPIAAEKALRCEVSELGVSGFGFDFRSMQHETIYARIYIS